MSVTDDGTMWSIICFWDLTPVALIGNVSGAVDSAKEVEMNHNMSQNEVMWRPGTHELVVIGENIPSKHSFIIQINGDTLQI